MAKRRIAPYGSWKSPITSDAIVAGSVGLAGPIPDGDDIYWTELRPRETGRSVVVRRSPDGALTDLTPPPFSARTRVHEYGGGAAMVHRATLYFSNFGDQRLYRLARGGAPEPLTPAKDLRYADAVYDERRRRLVAVREDHTRGGEAKNEIVALPDEPGGGGEVLVSGSDFVSSPRLSPDGARLCWLQWDHPNMPWDGTELFVGGLDGAGRIRARERVAGGPRESVFQPEWSPDGVLHFVSDRTGWWNLYRWRGGEVEALTKMRGEFGDPAWIFGLSTYAFESPTRVVASYTQNGSGKLVSIDLRTKRMRPLRVPFTEFGFVRAAPGRALFLGGSPTHPTSLALYDFGKRRCEVLRCSSSLEIDPGYLTRPRHTSFPTKGGKRAHALYYPPRNKDFRAPEGERPPLLVRSHGGPTGQTSSAFDARVQYWTSRGFAVLDVDYGGSTGYGRAYRERLVGKWGIVDVDDCCSAALDLVRRGLADRRRLAIHGGSAGGFTTLAALAFRKVFKAGGCYFGVSDLAALARDTHKFESRYLDGLVGPYPEKATVYAARSPIHHLDGLRCPVIFFQGLEDKVVPPSQSELMVDALRKKGIPVAYLAYEGEQHGFRKADNIKRSLDAELYFYSRILRFEPADRIEPVKIENLQAGSNASRAR